MDIRSTKTRIEQLDDEAARLVRPAPKLKPPRRDRRRERVDPDKEVDPDEAQDRKDKSQNYKNVGGSIAQRVAARFMVAMEFATKEERDKYLEEHPGADPSKHTVKEEKEEKKPDEEEATEKEPTEESEKDLPAIGGQLRELGRKDKALGAQLKLFQPGGFYWEMAKENPGFSIAQLPWSKALPEGMHGLSLGDIRDAIGKAPAKSKTKPGEVPQEAPKPEEPGAAPPETAKSEVEPGAAPPEATPPTGAAPSEVQKEKPPKSQALKKPTAPKRENYDTEEDFKASQDSYQKALDSYKAQRQEQAKSPKPQRKDFDSEDDFEKALAKHQSTQAQIQKDLSEDQPQGQAPAPQVPAKPRIHEPVRPAASRMEKLQAHQQLLDVFGDTTAAELAATGIHPQDVSTLADMYQAVSSKPEKNFAEHAAKVAEFYQTDPRRVPPPKSVQNASGHTVPFDQLTPEEQGEAYRKHQLRTVAISLAAEKSVRDSISEMLPKDTDRRLAGELAAVLLQPPNEGRSEWANRAADRSYQTALQSAGEPISPSHVKTLLDSLGDNEDAKKIAVGYLQGQDFNIAKNIFLRQGVGGGVKKGLGWVAKATAAPAQFLWDLLTGDDRDPDYEIDSEEAEKVANEYENISEWSSPKQIGKGIRAAQDFFDLRARNYPSELADERDPSQLFRHQVIQRIRALSPDKYAPVKAYLEEYDFNRYEQKQADYEHQLAEWETDRDLHLHQVQGKEAEEPDRKKFKNDEEFEQAKAAQGALKEDRQAAEWKFEQENPKPKAPLKPVNYDQKRNPKALRAMRKWLLAEQFSQHGGRTAAAVAARYVISSYPSARLMVSVSEKAAVYHGVAPYKNTPNYTPWEQPRQRDIGDADYEVILTAAREWMKTPVLSLDLRATPKDVQLRAALDLAIYDSQYNGQIQPNAYNLLLARLAGADSNETLLTQGQPHKQAGMVVAETLKCTMEKDCKEPVSMIDNRGFTYCTKHGERRKSGGTPCRKLRPGEIKKLENDETIKYGSTDIMKASQELRKMAAKYAAENAPLAYDLMNLATRLAQDEQGQEQGQQEKQAQDQQDQGQDQEKQAAKYASLRSAVIQAAHKNPDARTAFLPVLQAVKSLDV